MPDLLQIPAIIGHRGAAADAPENTLLSIRTAWQQGARMVEFDVKLSGGVAPELILMHDESLERTTNGNGWVRDHDITALKSLDAGSGEKIPTLRDVIGLLAALDMAANIEIKPCDGRAIETAAATIACVRQYWPASKPLPILSSFDYDALKTCQELWPECPRGALFGQRADDWYDIVRDLAASTLHIGYRHENDQGIRDCVATGLPVLVYTVNDPAQARHLFDMNVSAIFTDCPARMLTKM